MNYIYCLVGISGSGKTTLAREMIKYLDAVIISRDQMRNHLFGYTEETVHNYYLRDDVARKEKIITKHQDRLIESVLDDGVDVILDNTHLKLSYINELKKFGVPIRFTLVDTDFETALERDQARLRHVGEDVIRRQFEQLEHLKKVFDFKEWWPEDETIEQDTTLFDAVIFDIDSTLALNTSGRSPYNWKEVGKDEVNPPVLETYRALQMYGLKMVICSGRDSICRPETEKWLSDNKIVYHELHMRPQGDQRKDAIVKEEFWRDISTRYNIRAMFDDRLSVINHARRLGFVVFDCAGNTF